MTDDLTTVLRDRAERGSDPGIAAVYDAAVMDAAPRRRRRHHRTRLVATALVTVVVVAATILLARTDDSANVAIAPHEGSAPTDNPPGATEISASSGTIHLDLPAGWAQTPGSASTTPSAVLTIGTDSHGPPNECMDSPPVGTWLILYEYVGYQDGSPLPVPGGGGVGIPGNSGFPAMHAENLHDRPTDFLNPNFFNANIACGKGNTPSPVPQGIASWAADRVFRDGGRVFLARIVTTDQPTAGPEVNPITTTAFNEGLTILNTLRVDPNSTAPTAP
jgi:hypothetical protein